MSYIDWTAPGSCDFIAENPILQSKLAITSINAVIVTVISVFFLIFRRRNETIQRALPLWAFGSAIFFTELGLLMSIIISVLSGCNRISNTNAHNAATARMVILAPAFLGLFAILTLRIPKYFADKTNTISVPLNLVNLFAFTIAALTWVVAWGIDLYNNTAQSPFLLITDDYTLYQDRFQRWRNYNRLIGKINLVCQSFIFITTITVGIILLKARLSTIGRQNFTKACTIFLIAAVVLYIINNIYSLIHFFVILIPDRSMEKPEIFASDVMESLLYYIALFLFFMTVKSADKVKLIRKQRDIEAHH